MFLKRRIPILIVIIVGLLTLFGHFITQKNVQEFVDNDATQWFDIIASFAIFLGALNLLKLQMTKIIRKKKNWQYSILAVLGFFFALFAGFLYRGANTVTISGINEKNINGIAQVISENIEELTQDAVKLNLQKSNGKFEYPSIFITEGGAENLAKELISAGGITTISPKPWGAHLQTEGSLFYWIFKYIFTPLSATMFALLAFFVASASYRAFRIRNFEATLLLVAGIILMLGRVPVGSVVSGWFIAYLFVLGLGAGVSPLFKDRRIIFGIVLFGLIIVTIFGFTNGWQVDQPAIFYLPILQDWIFHIPTTAGARALMIGIALGIVGTSFRIIIGIERSFLGE